MKISIKAGGSGSASRGCLTVFFLVFLGMGLLFTVVMAGDFFGRLRVRAWTTSPCTIQSARVDPSGASDGTNHRFVVVYTYAGGERECRGTGVEPGYTGSSSYGDALQLAETYPPGTQTTCYVNPSNPDETYLRAGSLLFGLLLLLPLVFVAIGAGGIWFAWRKRPAPDAMPISSRAPGTAPRWVAPLVFALFFLIGTGILLFVFVPMVREVLDARNWNPTPCTIVASSVKSHSSDDGTTYSVELIYAYTVDGREHKGWRYTFMGGSSSGYEGKQEIVDRFPPGTKAVCYVNPGNPGESVIERGFTWEYLLGLLPLVFMLIGAIGFVAFMRKSRRDAAAGGRPWAAKAGPGLPSVAGSRDATPGSRGPVALKPKVSPAMKLVGMLVAALFWNGIVSIFVGIAINSWLRGNPEWFLSVFIIPFVLVGLGLLAGVGYFVLALFNPRPEITIGAAAIPLGGSADVAWKVAGAERRIRRFRITLEGSEEATYRRGTSTTTDRHVFHAVDLVDTRNPHEIRGSRATLAVPAGVMHSFESAHNKIVWTLKVHGEIDRWPDVSEEFPIAVLPAKG
jgi:hypothetical protein